MGLALYVIGKIGGPILMFIGGFMVASGFIWGFTSAKIVLAIGCIVVGVLLKVLLVNPVDDHEVNKYRH